MKRFSIPFIKQFSVVIIASFVIIVVMAAFFFYIIPKFLETKNKLATLEKNAKELKVIGEKSTTLKSLSKETLQKNFSQAEAVLPSDEDLAYSLFSIESAIENNGLKLDNIALVSKSLAATVSTSSGTIVHGSGGKFIFSVSISGPTNEVESFFSTYEKMAPLTSLSNVSISYTSSGVAQANFTLSTFYSPLSKTLGDFSTPLVALSTSQKATLDLLSSFKSEANIDQALSPLISSLITPSVSPQQTGTPDQISIEPGEEATPASTVKRKNLFSF